jgi:two-component system, NarL family, response regulator LiaR
VSKLNMSIKVVIVDDHAVVRQGLQTYLSLDSEIEVTGTASSGPDALKLLHDRRKNAEPLPDIAVVDLYMPGMDGFATIEALGREFPTVKVVVLTNSLQENELLRALQLGVSGFLVKNYEVALVAKTIKAVSAAKNMVQLPNEAVQMLVDRITQNTVRGKPSPDILSERERKILVSLAEGRAIRKSLICRTSAKVRQKLRSA